MTPPAGVPSEERSQAEDQAEQRSEHQGEATAGTVEHQGEATAAARSRLIGVDVARGVALFGMMAVHVAGGADDGGRSWADLIAGGRSAATFALIAGVSLTFLSGGRTVLSGRRRTAASAGIAVRGVIIAAVGLLLAYLDVVDVILAFYGLMFIMAIPLIGLRSRALALLAIGFAVLGPVLLVATAGHGLPYEGLDHNPTAGDVVTDPVGMLAVLFLTGAYPIVVYFAYLCAGMAVGRLDLSSRRLAWWLFGGGLAAAVLAKLASSVLLYQLGGMERLVRATPAGGESAASVEQTLLSEPTQGSSWWYLALSSPHSDASLDLLHTLGAALAVLGAALLVTRLPLATRILRPVADAGAMTLTLYSAHQLLLVPGVHEDAPYSFLLAMIVASTGFAVLWRRRFGQGPLEGWVTRAAGRARRALEPRPVEQVADVERQFP